MEIRNDNTDIHDAILSYVSPENAQLEQSDKGNSNHVLSCTEESHFQTLENSEELNITDLSHGANNISQDENNANVQNGKSQNGGGNLEILSTEPEDVKNAVKFSLPIITSQNLISSFEEHQPKAEDIEVRVDPLDFQSEDGVESQKRDGIEQEEEGKSRKTDPKTTSAANDSMDDEDASIIERVRRKRRKRKAAPQSFGFTPFEKMHCDVCDHEFTEDNYMEEHRCKRRSKPKVKPYQCDKCDFATARKNDLKRHEDVIHLELKPFQCDKCEYRTASKGYFKIHVNTVHLKIKPFLCSECDYRTASKVHLERHFDAIHLKIPRSVEKHSCDQCDHVTTTKSNLKRHIDAIHLKIKPFQCDQCNYSSSCNSDLKCHVDTKHLKLKNFHCDKCNYATASKGTLKKHIDTIHFKIKPFQCEKCSYATISRGHLKNHVDKIHNTYRKHRKMTKYLRGEYKSKSSLTTSVNATSVTNTVVNVVSNNNYNINSVAINVNNGVMASIQANPNINQCNLNFNQPLS